MENLKEQFEKRLKTLEDAYKETGRPIVDFSAYPEDLRKNREAEYNAIVLVEAARKIERENGFGEIDWNDSNQWKYTPWFWMSPSAFAFADSLYVNSTAIAGSGSRLRLLSEIASTYIAETFIEIWKTVQLL